MTVGYRAETSCAAPDVWVRFRGHSELFPAGTIWPDDGRNQEGGTMTWRHVSWIGLMVVTTIGVAAQGRSSTTPPMDGPTMRSEMRAKLTNAQILLAAVVTRDFRTIDTVAERLSRISEMEIASWQARPAPPQYTQQGVEFLSAVQDLRQAAQARDIAKAGAAFTKLTSSCVTCHRYGRDIGAAPR
jgi:hypothetical protein